MLRRPFRLMLRACAALSAATAVLWLASHADQVSLHPGPATDLVEHVTGEVRDPDFDRHGPVRMTTVEIRKMRNWEVLAARLPWRDVELAPAAATSPEATAAGIRQMAASRTTAALVAAAAVDGPEALEGYASGAEVLRVTGGSPAERSGIARGDVITAVDGSPVTSDTSLRAAFESRGAGSTVEIQVSRGEDRFALDADLDADGRLGVEVRTHFDGDPPLTVATRGVGGASAGLMMTLAFVDALSEGDLTAGLDLAGTGTISLDGTVGTVRGVTHKVRAARDAGADVFFAPAGEAPAARRVAAGDIEVVAVADVADAVGWLCDHGATDAVCERGP